MKIALSASGVSLLLVCEGGLPEIVHWGAEVGAIDAAQFDALISQLRTGTISNGLDQHLPVAVLPEARFGWMGTPGLIGSRDGMDWSPVWELQSAEIDGQPFTGDFHKGGAASVTFRAGAPLSGLGLAITIELLPQGLVRARAELTNTGESPYVVDQLTLALPIPSRAREILDFAGHWAKERTPQRAPLTIGTHRREGRKGRTGADAAYILNVGVPGFGYDHGEVWAVHTAWSGNHLHLAERTSFGLSVLQGGELLLPCEGKLEPGNSYSSPWVYGNYANGLDEQASRFHEFLRSLPVSPKSPRPVSLNCWEAVYFDHEVDRLIDLIERAAAVGVERFVLDDGWFGSRRSDNAGLGDWVVSTDVHPEGLHPLVNRTRELGMEFGLWFEPEMINEDSDLARAHPEWIMQPAGRLPVRARTQQVLNLSIDAAFDHVFNQMSAILSEYEISYVKWDHNRDLVDAGTAPDGRPAVSAQTHAFYRLLDRLREAHPGMEFESCSSGGARIDLEVMQRAERVWVSDNIDPHSRQPMMWWTGQLLPLELMGSHIASGVNHITGRHHTLGYRAATAVFGHLGIEWDLAKATEQELEELQFWVQWYKENRELLHAGRLIRVDMGNPDWFFKGVVTPERAIYSLAVQDDWVGGLMGEVRFPGLEPDRLYEISVVGSDQPSQTLTGRQLAVVGLRAPLMRPESAVIYEVKGSEPARLFPASPLVSHQVGMSDLAGDQVGTHR